MEDTEGIKSESISLDVGDLYQFTPNDLTLNIIDENYSNLAYVQITDRDVKIDFLRMPGLKKEGKMVINGTRIYMTHAAAQKMSLAILATLKKVDGEGILEKYNSDTEKEYEASRVIKRKQITPKS